MDWLKMQDMKMTDYSFSYGKGGEEGENAERENNKPNCKTWKCQTKL